jgi:transcriptional antiterminator RfaH
MSGPPHEFIVPPDPESAVPDGLPGRWWVAHTRSRNEKALARDLARLKIVHYLPLRSRVTQSRATKRFSRALVPVFTGYVFLNATPQQRYHVMRTNRVARTLFVLDQQRLVAQLRSIHRVLTGDTAFEQVDGIHVGQWVRVVAGSLIGVEGCVVRRLGRTRLAISVDTLGQSVLVEVPAELLEPAEAPPVCLTGRVSRPR